MVENKPEKKQEEIEVEYHYVEPKDEKEAKNQVREVNSAFDKLFKEVKKDRKAKKDANNN